MTDHGGHASYVADTSGPFRVHTEMAGYFDTDAVAEDSGPSEIRLVLTHKEVLVQSITVAATPLGIDPQLVSDTSTFTAQDITNVPYPTSRDIRRIFEYFPGVIQGRDGQAHIAGSDASSVLYSLDAFDVRSPYTGLLALRFSADAVRGIEKQDTRYPVEYGRNTGGVISFRSVAGDNRFRFDVTDFFPQFEEVDGFRFDKFVPRVSFSGPIRPNRAFFFDAVEVEINQRYESHLPQGHQTNLTERGSNLLRLQWLPTGRISVSSALLFNAYHSPFEGLSRFQPQQSTTKHNMVAWMPDTRVQMQIRGALLDAGFAMVRFNDRYSPYPGHPYTLTPGGAVGSYFESMSNISQSLQSNALLYLPPRHWHGEHDLKSGIELEAIRATGLVRRSPVFYLRANRTLLRQSTFPATPAFTQHDLAVGVHLEDDWRPNDRVLLESGLRFDWDEITTRATWSPRFAVAMIPNRNSPHTKISTGVGLYYEHTALDYLARSSVGEREDTYYAPNGRAPLGPALQTSFTASPHSLMQPYALNWSVGVEQRLRGSMYVTANYLEKYLFHQFTYVNQNGPEALAGTYDLTNMRSDIDRQLTVGVRYSIRETYNLFAGYTRASTWSNAVIDYTPGVSYLGPQQAGVLPWDSPNQVVSWGWLPMPVPQLRKRWDFAWSLNWHTGLPYLTINANREVVGPANVLRMPDYFTLNPGVEFKFHVRGSYFGLRTVVENVTNAPNPLSVNNNVDSRGFGQLSGMPGRGLSARIRLIELNEKSRWLRRLAGASQPGH